ncbi:MMPL family transporter [Bacillus spongiae]|uniref:MMPL family transporter n=2 Tax=Bacillus spongiae TaxID=2683610 RepID=A0ABU8HH96_9BACI
MKHIVHYRWGIALLWIIITFILFTTMPNVDQLVREKGQPKIPDEYSSVVSKQLINELENQSTDSDRVDVVLVFHEDTALTEQQMTSIENEIKELKVKENELGINAIATHFVNDELTDQFVSEDKTTVMAVLNMDRSDRKISELREDLQTELEDSEVQTYLTGNEFINEDQIQTAGEGVKKTEVFTVLFIIVVLIFVFRSPVTPIISLLTVGITYICSLSIVAHLVDKLQFPFSTTTQTFLILVLFGIGTDYNILLLSRFKEELSKGIAVKDAIIQTFKTAGKTVLYSALAVFVGFSILGFAKFSVFQSSVAVAVAVATLVVALYTLMPFFMMVLGRFMFWPVKQNHSHGESKIWIRLGRFSIARPLISLIIVAIVTIPVIVLSNSESSYNSLEEVSDSYESVQGFAILSEKFSQGKALPSTVVIKSDVPLNTNEQLDWIDDLTEKINEIEGVEKVYSPTRPKGERIEELYMENQVDEVGSGLSSANDGIDGISEGLSEASEELSGPSDSSEVDELIKGTEEMIDSVDQLNAALQTVGEGVSRGANGSLQLANSVATIETSMTELNTVTMDLHSSYTELQNGYTLMGNSYLTLSNQLSAFQSTIKGLKLVATELQNDYPELQEDANMMKLHAILDSTSESLKSMINGLAQLNNQLVNTNKSFQQANEGLSSLTNGQAQISSGLIEIEQNLRELSKGLDEGNQGQEAIITNMASLQAGLGTMQNGQLQLKSGLKELSIGMKELEEGLTKSTEGLDEISSGLMEATSYLEELTVEEDASTFTIPQEMLEGEYQQVLDQYMSENRHLVKMTLELSVDPYSQEAMAIIDEVDELITKEIQTVEHMNTSFAIGGISSINNDLDSIAKDDFIRTVSFMLIGILLVLIVILREFWTPVMIIGSLILGYYTALSMTELLFVNAFGYDGLSWTIPFFSFIMITALGVDYSIFLMMRYKENQHLPPVEALLLSKKQIGNVVISAAVILSGTFAAMYPAGVLSLTQIATVVIIGLTLLTFIMLPVFIPALFSIKYKTRQSRRKKSREIEGEI